MSNVKVAEGDKKCIPTGSFRFFFVVHVPSCLHVWRLSRILCVPSAVYICVPCAIQILTENSGRNVRTPFSGRVHIYFWYRHTLPSAPPGATFDRTEGIGDVPMQNLILLAELKALGVCPCRSYYFWQT